MQLKLNLQQSILIKSECLMLGHYHQQIFWPIKLDLRGFYQTQDSGELVEQQLFVRTRNDLIFISGGENISPVEIENIIAKNKLIHFGLVVPVSHKQYGHLPFLFYLAAEDILPIKIKHTLTQYLPNYKRPKYYYPLSAFDQKKDLTSEKASRYQYLQLAESILNDSAIMQSDILKKSMIRGNPESPPLIFFHGMMGSPSNWAPIIQQLQQDYYCLALPLPGHNNFKMSKNNFRQLYFQAIANIINSFSHKVTLIGYSMGGRMILEYLKYNDSNIKTCILESVSFGLDSQQHLQVRLKKDQQLFQSINNRDKFKLFLEKWYQADLFANMKQHINFTALMTSLLKRQNEIPQWQECLNEFSVGKQENFENYIALINFNFHYLSGKKDQKYDRLGKKYSSRYDNLKHYRTDDCGHNIHFEQSDYFVKLLKQIF